MSLRSTGLGFSALLVLCSSASAQSPNPDGCWEPQPRCLTASTEWDEQVFQTMLTNNCLGRVYVQVCHTRRNRSADCGEFAIPQGKSDVFETAKAPTGASNWLYIGSQKPSKDAACTSQLTGWADFKDRFAN
ncbi:MAG: hypothetical protein AAF829_04955 [Pseudomonadota bacterium]